MSTRAIIIGLAVLYDLGREAEYGAYEPAPSLRAVLALLHAVSNGDRRPYDGFWKAATEPPGNSPSELIGKVERCNAMRAEWHGILRTLGFEASIDVMKAIHRVRPSRPKSDGPL